MFRTVTLALAAATIVGTAAIPTAASARDGWRHHHRPGVSVRIGAPAYAYAPRHYGRHCYTTKRWTHTRWGWKLHRVRHCR